MTGGLSTQKALWCRPWSCQLDYLFNYLLGVKIWITNVLEVKIKKILLKFWQEIYRFVTHWKTSLAIYLLQVKKKHLNKNNKPVKETKKNITRNCSKLRKIHSGQGHTSLPNDFSSEYNLIKPFVFLSFIFESTDRYNFFHMTHLWQLRCCSMRQICCDLMIRN